MIHRVGSVFNCDVFPVPDPDWPPYERDGDGDKLAAKHTGFYRATFMPSLASALAPERGAEGRRAFTDRLSEGLRRKLAEAPAPLVVSVQAIVLAKHGEA